MIDVIAFDADDTLWHNESIYFQAKTEFADLYAGNLSSNQVLQQLNDTEIHNLQYYGYGIKSFSLSMIETALDIDPERVDAAALQQVLDIAKGMLTAEVLLLDQVEETIATLSSDYKLMLITKGDLFEQDGKINRSGIAHHFQVIEIVSEKTSQRYKKLLAKYSINPQSFLMVGNSMRSDILPVIEIGGQAVYIPYPDIWEHEKVNQDYIDKNSYYELGDISQLPDLIEKIER